jgi:lipopolysaccharide export LptBFGC system permease protein LptF
MVRPILDEAAKSLTAMPGYPDAWAETLRKSHRLSFADPRNLPAEADSTTSLTLDVAPLVALVVSRVTEASPVPLKAPDEVHINIGQSNQRQLIERVSAYAPMGSAVAVGAAIAFLLALVAARRKWTVLAGAGIGALILAALWKLGADAAGRAVLGAASGNDVAEIFKREFVAASTAGFGQWILAVVVVGAVLLVAGAVLRAAGSLRRRPNVRA